MTGNMQEVLIKVFINMNRQTVTNKLSKEDISDMIKSNLNEVQNQNRACLTKSISGLRYLAHEGILK